MRMKVLGRLRQDYRLDSGYEFHGVKYFGLNLDETKEGLQGSMTMDLKVPDSSPLSASPFEVGAVYRIYFNQKGVVEFVQRDDGQPSSFGIFDGLGSEVNDDE